MTSRKITAKNAKFPESPGGAQWGEGEHERNTHTEKGQNHQKKPRAYAYTRKSHFIQVKTKAQQAKLELKVTPYLFSLKPP